MCLALTDQWVNFSNDIHMVCSPKQKAYVCSHEMLSDITVHGKDFGSTNGIVHFGQPLFCYKGPHSDKLIAGTCSDELYSVGEPDSRCLIFLQRRHRENEAVHCAY